MWAIVVSALVGLVHIYHDELWALVLAPLQTLYHLVAALLEGEAWLLVVVEIGVGVTVVYLYIRACPIEYADLGVGRSARWVRHQSIWGLSS